MRSWIARGGAMLVLAAGIVAAVLLPNRIDFYPHPCDRIVACYAAVNLRMPLRVAIASAAIFPLSVVLAGRSVRRWMVVVASLVVSWGIIAAVLLPTRIIELGRCV